MPEVEVRRWAVTSKGSWRIAGTMPPCAGPNAYWHGQGFSVCRVRPCVERLMNRRIRGSHGRWCERGRGNLRPYSITTVRASGHCG